MNKSKNKKKKKNYRHNPYRRPRLSLRSMPLDEEQQKIANPFGFASHNSIKNIEDNEEKKDDTKEAKKEFKACLPNGW